MSANNKIELNQSNSITLTKQENLFVVKENDWKRLKRVVDRCVVVSDWWQVISSFSFGLSASAIIALISSYSQQFDAEKWVRPCLLIASIACIIIGIVCHIVHKKERDMRKSSISDIKEAIQDIEININKD